MISTAADEPGNGHELISMLMPVQTTVVFDANYRENYQPFQPFILLGNHYYRLLTLF